MIAWLMPMAGRLLTSRAGLVALAAVALWTWHVTDKRQAVDAAREGLVQEFELSAAQAELEALQARAAAVEAANAQLRGMLAAAEVEARQHALELEEYERETTVDPTGRVNADLLRRLRNR